MTIDTIDRSSLVCRIVYDDGTAIEVAITPSLARWIARFDAAERKRRERRARREKTFTDAGIDANGVVAPYRSPRLQGGYPPEGPYYPISHLIGESRIWPGPRLEDVAPLMAERLNHDFADPWSRVERPGYPEPCEFCRGMRLQTGELCLRCTASGYDGNPRMHPSRADLARRIEAPRRDDGLRGGR
jgi:hypothetical protein